MEWEYTIQLLGVLDKDEGINKAERALNEMGSKGWEIFSVIPEMGENKSWFFAFAKRPSTT